MEGRSKKELYAEAVVLSFLVIALMIYANRLFGFLIHPEGYRAYSPIMMLQGTPLSHLESEHPYALCFYRWTRPIFGTAAVSALILFAYLGWARFITSRPRRLLEFLATLGLLELTLLLLNIPMSASLASHHSGWGMPCHHRGLEGILMVHLIGFPLILPLLAERVEIRDH